MIEELRNGIYLELSTIFMFRYNVQKMQYGSNLALSVSRKCLRLQDEDEVILVFDDTGITIKRHDFTIEYTTSSILEDITNIIKKHLG